ncbi:hypothetical protein [Thiohalorhabdus methylotrophus]|uniref:Uncharacterized protein n=1 Tax=Thiohalorhabdus methylotrophus TaxID=3242694 RepID=A0ABV4TUC5_9GAMM
MRDLGLLEQRLQAQHGAGMLHIGELADRLGAHPLRGGILPAQSGEGLLEVLEPSQEPVVDRIRDHRFAANVILVVVVADPRPQCFGLLFGLPAGKLINGAEIGTGIPLEVHGVPSIREDLPEGVEIGAGPLPTLLRM